ncbi:succinate dehydrogenase cytochrome b560 subunit, mitochondrial-like [Pieris brassicae]|uniref:succinate dehydrogenase cytochrome b560 subunit, mitochondrial-like n=1 Tax=Pieris brassicae TaxID=7116 RepID=UPI001E662645|nr:succinate dehydrogenase cytochrome b560 subunit, mitochondrial-like [Pieris brassicae]
MFNFIIYYKMLSIPVRGLFKPKYAFEGFNMKLGMVRVMCAPCGCSPDKGKSQGGGGSKSKYQITYKPYQIPEYKPHDKKNMDLNRPMSPHVFIYAPTEPAMTSIVERITGMILTFYALVLSCGTLFLSNGVETYVSIIQSLDLSRPMIFLIKLSLGAPFAFHYFNGIRFCLWNACKMLSIKEVNDSAKKVYIGTAVLSVLFALF